MRTSVVRMPGASTRTLVLPRVTMMRPVAIIRPKPTSSFARRYLYTSSSAFSLVHAHATGLSGTTRMPVSPRRGRGRNGEGVGCEGGGRGAHPQGARGQRALRVVQPGRHAGRHREPGRDGEGVGLSTVPRHPTAGATALSRPAAAAGEVRITHPGGPGGRSIAGDAGCPAVDGPAAG